MTEAERRSLKRIEKELVVFGEGGDGSITINPDNIDFKIVKVNFSERVTVTISNESNCMFYIMLRLVNDDDGACEEGENNKYVTDDEKI